jgi:zinc transporter, ZIP family
MEGWPVAAGLALAATSSLIVGAALGLYANAPQRVIAAVMAFGSGALIQALAVDLAYEGAHRLVQEHQLTPLESWLWVAGGFVAGGAVYYEANRWIEKSGGHLRKPARMKAHLFRQVVHLPPALSVYDHGAESRLMAEQKAKSGSDAPVAIFLGALLDGIPESIVIGAGFTTLVTLNPTFLVAVFLSNLPEAMSSAAGMRRAGFSATRIFSLWGGLAIASAVAAALGNIFLQGAAPTLLTLVEAIAGGGILAMLASTMMPEAFEHGGPSVGLATIAGFLSAFFFTTLGL